MLGLKRRLARDEEGAILVAGLFVTAFLIGMLYMLIGASTAMEQGELMQDGADSAAFTAAQTHAKAMNLIALNNMVKVAGVATLVGTGSVYEGAFDTIQWILEDTERIEVYGWTIPFLLIPLIQGIIGYIKANVTAELMLQAADRAQKTLIDALPLVTERLINDRIQPTFSPPVTSFFMSPMHTLPVEEEDEDEICDRMEGYANDQKLAAFIVVPDIIIMILAWLYTEDYFEDYCDDHKIAAMIPNDVLPGEEEYQIRVFAGGDELSTTGEKGVQVATWKGNPGADQLTQARDLMSRISFAQAEYYYSGSTSKDAALWSMNWRARLRRFRWPGGSLSADCARQGGPAAACAALPQYLESMSWAIAH